MNFTAQVVTVLPPRMKQAMINHLNDQTDDLNRLAEAFEKHKLNIKSTKWPDDSVDTKRRKASLSPARNLIARRMGLNSFKYQKWVVTEELIMSKIHDKFKEY